MVETLNVIVMEGIEVSDDTLMLDEAGPGGHFLNTE